MATDQQADCADQQAGCAGSSDTPKNTGIDWADPNVPPGNAPPMPRWPLVLSAVAWIAWLAFLVMMAVERTSSATV